ncbi:MAG: alkaline phosphatase family protein [Micropruina glycogenica]
MFERLAKAGVYCATVTPARFRWQRPDLVCAAGAHFFGYADDSPIMRRVEYAARAAQSADRSLVYLYERDLDHTGHKLGVASPQWQAQLSRVNDLVAWLRDELAARRPADQTGDHGMVDARSCAADHRGRARPGRRGAAGGRRGPVPSALHHSTRSAVARGYRDRLGERACAHQGRGHRRRLVRPCRGWPNGSATCWWPWPTTALMTTIQPNELGLVGMHGC